MHREGGKGSGDEGEGGGRGLVSSECKLSR